MLYQFLSSDDKIVANWSDQNIYVGIGLLKIRDTHGKSCAWKGYWNENNLGEGEKNIQGDATCGLCTRTACNE